MNVRFYDKNNNLIERNDKKTKPHRIAYVEAYLSVYDSRFESYRRFLNNDGTININKIPTELLNIVAYRVPSEGAYSIFPIRVVGFTDSVSQGIMLPTDLLQISGFDFDIDKLFFFAKEFFFDKEHKLIIPKIRINGKNREDIIQSVTNQGSSKAALDNTFIDLLLEQMTSPEYTAKFFEPGSVTKLERIADILQVTEFYTEKELLKLFPGTNSIEQTLINLSSKELRELIKNKKQLSSPIFFEEALRNRREVMSGASLISRFALTNSAHAKLNNLGIEILKNQVIKLNGKELYILDPSTVESDEKIEFISRIIASFISSAVDNTKNPILGKLNANETTVNYITYLLRLGYNPMEVLLFMSQPIIKDFVNTAESDNNSNTPHKYIFQDVLQRYEDKFKKLTALEDIDRLSISKIDINNDLMLNSLLNAKIVRKNEVLLQNQLAIGYMFQKILPVAEMNKNLTLILRGDTTAFAGGKISNVKARELAIERFKIANQETGFLMGANDLITNLFPEHKTLTLNLLLEQKLPIVQAFTNGALFKTKELLKNYFPQYKPGYEDLISNISNMTKSGILSEYVLTELFFHSMIYFLQNNPLFGDEYLPKIKQVIPAVDKRAYYYFGFMKDWKKTIEDNPELSKLEFINRFTYTPLEFAGYNKISFKNSGKITGALRELYELEQNILMSTKKGKTLLTELFQYEYFTNGLKFSNDGFSHLFTTFLKEQLDTVIGTDQNVSPTYLETVRSILTLAEDFSGKEEFLHQFIQNHPKLTALVQSADNTTYKKSFIDTDGNIRETIDISLTDLKGKNKILLKDHLLYDDELSTLQNALHDYISFDNGRILYRKTSLSSEKYNHVTYENVSILSSLEYEIGRDVQTALTQEMRNKYDPIKTKSTVSRNGFDKITENDDPYHNRNHYNDEITIENSTKKDAPNVKQLDLFAELPSNNFKDANNEFPC